MNQPAPAIQEDSCARCLEYLAEREERWTRRLWNFTLWRLRARDPMEAIFLDALQGAFEKIQFQRLARHQALQLRDPAALPFFSFRSHDRGRGAGVRPRA